MQSHVRAGTGLEGTLAISSSSFHFPLLPATPSQLQDLVSLGSSCLPSLTLPVLLLRAGEMALHHHSHIYFYGHFVFLWLPVSLFLSKNRELCLASFSAPL